MYTVVLMAALTTTPAVPDFGHRRRCHGCSGGYSGCCGGGGYGCSGGGYGCSGGGYGCSGGGGYGCSGGGYGAYGAWGDGSYYGATPYANGYYAGTQWVAPGYGYGTPYQGGYYQGGYYQGGSVGQPGVQVPAGTMQPQGQRTTPSGTQRAPATTPEQVPGGQVRGPAPARLLVNLPEDARLQIDGVTTHETSATRSFFSPPLEPGQEYFYTLTAQITRDGQPITVTQRVNVRAGQSSQVTLNFPMTSATARR